MVENIESCSSLTGSYRYGYITMWYAYTLVLNYCLTFNKSAMVACYYIYNGNAVKIVKEEHGHKGILQN